MECTDLSSTDRVTRQKIRGLNILCNSCSVNLGNFTDLKKVITDFKLDIQKKLDDNIAKLSTEITQLKNKIVSVEATSYIEITEKIANEAVTCKKCTYQGITRKHRRHSL
ncbi:unnamed protein product [Psylliodes chrysocephalus]|uniref:Uncharacterized protein n=1 Tax=Psylliodes chrysocephalus TaxID=3402493 RepID=A0A9P0D1S8_9CUCU|nr:unnamed protein product [Psylliodes chrysocephala]